MGVGALAQGALAEAGRQAELASVVLGNTHTTMGNLCAARGAGAGALCWYTTALGFQQTVYTPGHHVIAATHSCIQRVLAHRPATPTLPSTIHTPHG